MDGIVISASAIHGKGAYITRPFQKGKLGRYAPDVQPISASEADMLPHEHQDYLVKVNIDNQEVFLNGEDSKDYSVFINHSWGAANVEIDDAGFLHLTKDIPVASVESPVELLLNYGHPYWWDKLLNTDNIGNLSVEQKLWLETVVPDNKLLLTGEELLTYNSWHQRRKTPTGLTPSKTLVSPTVSVCFNNNQHNLPTLTPKVNGRGKEQDNLSDSSGLHCYPTFKRVTINITSFGPLHDPTKGRLSKVLKMLERLLQHHDIIYVQETHLTTLHQIDILKTYFAGCHIFGSVSDISPAQAGVLIIIKNSVSKHYNIDSHYSSTSQYGKGRVVSVKFTPKSDYKHHLFSFRETCIYLKSGSGKGEGEVSPQEERKLVVQELCTLPRDTHICFLGGDINQHTNNVLEPFLAANQMEEVEQEINTFYRMDKHKSKNTNKEGIVTSTRIDRWYCNISAAQTANVSPMSRVLSSTKGTVGNYCGGRLKDLTYIPSAGSQHATHITDHVPVGLYLPPPGEGGNAANLTTIPAWVIRHPLFKSTVMEHWKADFEEENAFTKLSELVSLISKTAAKINKDVTIHKPQERQETWKIALKTLSTLHKTADPVRIRKAAQDDPVVTGLISDFLNNGDIVTSSSGLRSYLDEHINDALLDSPAEHRKNLSQVERLSKAFPKHRERVTSLRDETREDTDNPTEMAEITKNYWEKHYAFKRLKIRHLSRFWKRHYAGKIISTDPKDITIEMVEKIILASGSTAPGPDNIPFSAYRTLVSIAAPVLHGVIMQLMKGVSPPTGFNNAIFHLLPKKGTGWISDTRPLSVSNTANRLIASIIKEAIQDSLYSFINRDQCGFWPGRNIEENLDHFNELFYKALDGDKEYSMFLFDISKAFDSVSHDAIHSILKHVGLPIDYCNAIQGLFHNISLTTNFKGGTNLSFSVHSGIKQGCPLSPLLFIVIMDVLHHFLKRYSSVDVKLYCDDTGAGDPDIASKIPGIKKAFELFKDCTGLSLNTTKTVLLTTLPPSKRDTIKESLDKNGWGNVKIVEEEIYLGVPFGRPPVANLGTAFNSRQQHFRAKMVQYANHSNTLSIAKRISLINNFALPLLSYPFRFFLIPLNLGNMIKGDIDGLLSKNCSFKTDAYTAKLCDMGARNGAVLRDYWVQNLAALASRTTIAQIENHPIKTKTVKLIKGNRRVVTTYYSWSMRFRTNRAIAVHEIEKHYGLKREHFVGKSQSEIYQLITTTMPYRLTPIEYHKEALTKWGLDPTDSNSIVSNHSILPYWVPDYAIFNHLHIVHNAISTTSRLAEIAWHSAARGSKKQPHIITAQPCYLCGYEEDNLNHIFNHCPITKKANTMTHFLLGTIPAKDINNAPDMLRISFSLPPRDARQIIPATARIEEIKVSTIPPPPPPSPPPTPPGRDP